MSTKIEINIGDKFYKLTVVKYLGYGFCGKQKTKMYECLCDCGNVKTVSKKNLRLKNGTKSCGCIYVPANKLDKEKALINALISSYKTSAKKRNLKFELNYEQTQTLIIKNCFYCGVDPQKVLTNKWTLEKIKYNGIDRVNNDKGYEIGNVVTCCFMCNNAKSDRTKEEFINWITKIYIKNVKNTQYDIFKVG